MQKSLLTSGGEGLGVGLEFSELYQKLSSIIYLMPVEAKCASNFD